MREINRSNTPGEVDQPAPTTSAPAGFLDSAQELATDSGAFLSGLTATLRAEGQLNAELVKTVVLSRIAEIVGWSLTWALLLIFAGYAIAAHTGSVPAAFAAVAILHLVALASLARLRRKHQQKIGFSRTRALLTGNK